MADVVVAGGGHNSLIAAAYLTRAGHVCRVLDARPQLKVIARNGVGYDAVDLDAATEHGIPVTVSPANARWLPFDRSSNAM